MQFLQFYSEFWQKSCKNIDIIFDSLDIAFKTKPYENWVTTCVTVTFGEGEEATTLQRIIDAQIVDDKIKLVYGYERTVLAEEVEVE